MQFSNDQRHADTLTFLGAVRDYIATWPAHPMNREMIQRIDTHLKEPCHRLIRDASHQKAGMTTDPAGRVVLRATLANDVLRLSRSGDLLDRFMHQPIPNVADSVLLSRLEHGEVIKLSPDKTLLRES
jgi:hypothetical protein